MSITNFKTATLIKLEAELEAWKKGEKAWTVSNQFDESVIESALQNIDKLTEIDWQEWMTSNADLMTLATAISEFEAPELSEEITD